MDLLAAWLNAPHLFPYYMQEPIARDEAVAKFLPRTRSDHPVKCLIAEVDGAAFGYLQWYLNRSFPEDSAAAAGEANGVSVDYYIGDAAFLGRGLGATMLAACRRDLDSLEHPDRRIFIQHDDRNQSARRCTEAAGFKRLRGFMRKDVPHSLYKASPIRETAAANTLRRTAT